MIALGIILLIVLVAIFAPYIAPADPLRGSMLRRLRPIGTPGYPLGADELGRDMLSRLIYGARLSLFMGVTPVPIAFVIGSAIGIIAGYVGGSSTPSIMRDDRRVLRLPVRAAGGRAVRRARRRDSPTRSCR